MGVLRNSANAQRGPRSALAIGYYLDCATAFFTSCNIDIEYSLEALCPGHRGGTVCRLAVARLTVFLTLVALQGRSSFTQYIDATARISNLTNREVQVMNLVIKGQRNKQIAFTLGISEKTVKVHRGNVMRKVSVDSVADLVRLSEIASKDIPH